MLYEKNTKCLEFIIEILLQKVQEEMFLIFLFTSAIEDFFTSRKKSGKKEFLMENELSNAVLIIKRRTTTIRRRTIKLGRKNIQDDLNRNIITKSPCRNVLGFFICQSNGRLSYIKEKIREERENLSLTLYGMRKYSSDQLN